MDVHCGEARGVVVKGSSTVANVGTVQSVDPKILQVAYMFEANRAIVPVMVEDMK